MNKKIKKALRYSYLSLLFFFITFSFFTRLIFNPVQLNPQLFGNQVSKNNNNLSSALNTKIENITVTKTETITTEFNPIGEFTKSATSITIELLNNDNNDVFVDFFDRVEGGYGINPSVGTPIPSITNQHGLLHLNWSSLEIRAKNKINLNYFVDQNKDLPVNLSINYMINQVPTKPDIEGEDTYRMRTPLGSNITISVTLNNQGEGLFVSTKTVKPVTIVLVTIALPSDLLGEPTYSLPPITTNEISGINQITFAALLSDAPVTLNVTAQVKEGGGWGLIELEPLRVDIIRSPEMISTLISAVNALLGVVTGLEGYWAYLTIESMLDQYTMITPLLELLVDILVSDFTAFNTIVSSLVNIGGNTIIELLNNMVNGPGLIRNLISLENVRGILNSTAYPLPDITILNELNLIENSTVQAIGSEFLAFLGSPVDLKLYNLSLAQNNTWDSPQMGGNLTAITVGNDLNKNSMPEIIVAYNWTKDSTIYTNISIFENQTFGPFSSIWNSTPLEGTLTRNCLGTGDFDQDNNKELFIGLTDNEGNGNLTIFEFNTTLDLSKYEFYNIEFQNAGISSLLTENGLNLDNDTNKEFVIGLTNGSVYVINGSWENGVINWTIKWSEELNSSCILLAHGDTDQDSREEILCSNTTQISLFENTSLGFRPLKNLTTYNLELITGDSDFDGNLEILTCNDTWINIFEPNISTTIIPGDEDPTKTTIIKTLEGYIQTTAINFSSSVSNTTKVTNLISGDFDLDGKKEIVTSNENGTILFYEYIGDNQYYKKLEYNLNTTQYGIKGLTTGDINNDGYPDLVIMGKDDKIHIISRPFDIYNMSARIVANLTMTGGNQTNLYVRIELKNVLITYPFPTLKNLTYIYNGTGPTLRSLLINVIENTNSTDNYHTSVLNQISPEGYDPLSGVIGVWYTNYFNYTTGQPLPGAINLYDPVPGHLLKGSFEGNNITFKINIGYPVNLVVNYSYYIFPNLFFGLNLTIIPPYNYSFPGSNSTMPAIYPFIAYLLNIRTSPLIKIIGNLTTSLSKQFLILNSTISPDIGPYKPIVFESEFSLADILNIFKELQNLTTSPFESGGNVGFTLPSNIPIDFSTLNQFGNFDFLSKLKMFTDPRIHSRFVTNISLSGDFSALNQAMNIFSLQSYLGLEGFGLLNNYTEYSDFPKGLNLKPILIKDVNNDGQNDTIVAVNGFYPTYEIRALNSSNQITLWNFPVAGPIVNVSCEGNNTIRVVALNIENAWLMANESQNSTIYTNNIIENQTSIDNRTVIVNYNISSYGADRVFGVWNRSQFNFTNNTPFNGVINYYNKSAGASFEGKTIHLSTDLLSNRTDVVINYTKKTNTTVIVNYPVKSVIGVWNASSQTGLNYYTGGSFNGKNIFLGTDLETPNSTVYIKYNYYSNASSFIYLLNFTGELIDSRENIINQTRYFNGTSYLPHTYIGPKLGTIQTPYIINCSTAQNPNNYLLLIFTEDKTFAINGTLETTPTLNLLFNNTDNKNKIWEISSGEIENSFLITDADNNSEKELLFVTSNGILYSYNLKNGSKLWNNNLKLGVISTIQAEDVDNDGIKEIIVGSTNNKIYAFKGNTGAFIWFNATNGQINDFTINDINGDGKKEIIAGSSDHNIYAINGTNGFILWKYNITGKVKSITIGDVNGDNKQEILFGSDENIVYCLNATNSSNLSIIWEQIITGKIITFQFSRTSNSITLQYDLNDRIFEMAYQSLDQFLGSSMNTASGMTVGIDSLLNLGTTGANINLASLTNLNLPKGIGLINFMTFQLQIISSLNELGQVTLAQREFTGKPEVREVGDNPNAIIIKESTNATINQSEINLTRFEIFNNDSNNLIRLNYFAVILKDDNGSIPMNQCRFYMWNGMEYLDIMNNQYYNMTLENLDLTYDNTTGELRFKPFIEIEPFDQKNATVDWKGRPIFIEIKNYTGNLNISYWADISILHPKVTYNTVTTSISYSISYPVFIVYTISITTFPITKTEQQFYEQLLSDPLFYTLFLIFSALFVEISFFRKREAHYIHRLAHRNMIKWLKKRESKWRNLLEKGALNKQQFNRLTNIKNRLGLEVQPRWYTEYCFNKIKKNTFLDMIFSTILLIPFWREIGKPNRLARIFNNMLSAIFGPAIKTLKKSGSWFKKQIQKKPKKVIEKKGEKIL